MNPDRNKGRIDVHHHLIPPVYRRALIQAGAERFAGAPLPEWDAKRSLAVMDANGIATALLSMTAPGAHLGDDARAITLARDSNDFAAELKREHAGRFGFFAILPMPLVEACCEEAIRALDQLDADGIVLLGSSRGVFLGDARFEPLMEALDRRNAVVFVHPNLHESSEQLGIDLPGFLMEFLCDTTRAACNLMFNGVTERYPGIRWILAHAGGFLPYIAWRLSLANAMPALSRQVPQGVMTYIRRFYFDTALSPSPFAMACLKELIEPSHLLFGSDFPFAPAVATRLQTDTLEASPVWDDAQKGAINRGNALALFPAYAGANEPVPAPARYSGLNAAGRIRRAATAPLGALAERMRRR